MEKKSKLKQKIRPVLHAVVPGFNVVSNRLNLDLWKVTNMPEFDKLKPFLLAIEETDQNRQKFQLLYSAWIANRKEVIKEVRALADNIDFHHRNTNIAQIPASIAGIGGGILTIVGLALIPVTFGASLGLTITGAVIGVGATATGIANSATDIGVKMHRNKKAKDVIVKHRSETDELQSVVDTLLKNTENVVELGTPEMHDALNELVTMNTAEAVKVSAIGLKNSVVMLKSIAHTIPKAAKSIIILRKSIGITAVAGATSIKTADIAADAAGGAAKALASTSAKVMRGFGFAFSAIGIAADLVTIGATTYDLAKGSKTKVAKQLKSVADQLEKEMKIMEKINAAFTENSSNDIDDLLPDDQDESDDDLLSDDRDESDDDLFSDDRDESDDDLFSDDRDESDDDLFADDRDESDDDLFADDRDESDDDLFADDRDENAKLIAL